MAIVFNDSLNASKELNLKFKNFKGVDFANTKLNVAMNRATDTRNMIHSDSINRKRMGWLEIGKDIFNDIKVSEVEWGQVTVWNDERNTVLE